MGMQVEKPLVLPKLAKKPPFRGVGVDPKASIKTLKRPKKKRA